ncbi:MAG: S-layer homology domain-containing protein [Vallitalea sp.]|nr:S-layer homology domain-containing protein [Vallitalea sp.]
MNILKKIIVLFIIVVLSINTNITFAATNDNNMDLNYKAMIINELEILLGDGKGYHLDEQLTRAQGVTLVTRILGKTKYINNNKDIFSNTNFKDVDTNQWYAANVGYCVKQGIINGLSNNTFKPNESISEKSFLKILLVSMGYSATEDFNWNSVYQFAYSVKLVDDSSYASRTQDNLNYLRKDVIDTVYRSLQLKDKKTGIRLIQRFIDNGKITKSKAIQYGLAKDDVKTKLEKVYTVNSSLIELFFNEHINLSIDNIIIHEADNDENKLDVKSVERGLNNSYIVKLDEEQISDKDYILYIEYVVDDDGNTSHQLLYNFIGYRNPEIKSNYMKISKLEPISNNIINVYFTHPVNENVLNTAYYTLTKEQETIVSGKSSNMIIGQLPNCDNGISLYFKDYIFEKEHYELIISGELTSKYGVTLNKGLGESIKFEGVTKENEPLIVKKIETISDSIVEIIFNKKINPVIAKQVFSYYITDYNKKPMAIEKVYIVNGLNSYGNVIRLVLKTQFKEDKEYDIIINNINDITRQFNITEKKYSFETEFDSTDSVRVSDINVIDSDLILLEVDQPLDIESASDINNYKINSMTRNSYSTHPYAVLYDKSKNPFTLKIYLPKDKLLPKLSDFELEISKDIKDEMGNKQSKDKRYEFDYGQEISPDVSIKEAVYIGDNSVKLIFNKEISLDVPNVLNNNYNLRYMDNGFEHIQVPIGTNYINPTTIILRFNKIDEDVTYEIIFNKLVDYGGTVTDNADKKYIETIEYTD